MSDEFPRRWTAPQFKGPRLLESVKRRAKARNRETAERKIMDGVRRKFRFCRFPFCGCHRFKFVLEVAHDQHRGMGGNPNLERTDPRILILICRFRHRQGSISLDKKTLWWEPRTAAGAEGPICWFMRDANGHDLQLAVESSPGVYEWASMALLEELARMER